MKTFSLWATIACHLLTFAGPILRCQAAGESSSDPLPAPANLTGFRGRNNEVIYFAIPAKAGRGGLWGTDIYTDDSSLASAAVHAGILAIDEAGIVKVTILPGQSHYLGSTRNGITSTEYGAFVGSYSVDVATPSNIPPQITEDPQSQTVPDHTSVVRFTSKATGSAPLSYQWYFNGDKIQTAIDTSLELRNVDFNESGNYTVVVTNAIGSVTSKVAVLTVNPNHPPEAAIAAPLNGAVFTEPASVLISATASDSDGTVAKVEYFWDDLKIGETSAPPYELHWDNVGAGTYSISARATDSSGFSVESKHVQITVLPRNTPVTSGLPDPGTLATYRGRYGQVYYFTVTGNAAAGPIWGTDIYTDDSSLAKAVVHAGLLADGETGIVRVNILASRDGYASTTRNGITSLSFGSFAGSYGVTTLQPQIDPPTMVLQPASQTIPTGAGVAFTAKGKGSVPLSYQWLFNEKPISNELDTTLRIQNLTFGNAGRYSVLITNSVGSITSQVAVLTIVSNVPPQVALTSPLDGTAFIQPASIALAATASDIDGAITKVQFFSGDTLIGESTNAPYTFTWQHFGDATFSLSAVATDTSGATTKSAPITVTAKTPEDQIVNAPAGPGNLTAYRGHAGESYYFVVTGNVSAGGVWGTDIYTDDSALAAAAIHAGVLTNGQTAIIKVIVLPGQSGYASSTRNGITTSAYGSWVGSYSVLSVSTPLRRQPVFAVEQTHAQPDGSFLLTADPVPGAKHFIDYSTDLTNWTELTSVLSPTVRFQVTDPEAKTQPHRFYRIRLGAP